MSQSLPTVVIVGRPNVGKSTLFNRITGQRRAIVGDQPGITRDRLHGLTDYRGRRFELIDTGGIVVDDSEYIPSQILKQARVALKNAAHIVFLVDGRAEITAPDRDLARMLLRLGQPISLAVNKADTGAREDLAHDFYSLISHDAIIGNACPNTSSQWSSWAHSTSGNRPFLTALPGRCRAVSGHPTRTKAALGRGITNEATPG
jgi:small GTP-binding protein